MYPELLRDVERVVDAVEMPTQVGTGRGWRSGSIQDGGTNSGHSPTRPPLRIQRNPP